MKGQNRMYRAKQYRIRKGHKFYSYCDSLCLRTAVMYNRCNFLLRQYATAVSSYEDMKPLYDNQMKVYREIMSVTKGTKYEPKGKWLSYNTLDYFLKETKDAAYYSMPSQANQQIIKQVLQDYKSFFESCKAYAKSREGYTGCPKMPRYKKEGSYVTAVLTNQICRIQEKKFVKFPGISSRLNLGMEYKDARLKQVKIKKQSDSFEINVILELPDVCKKDERTDEEIIALFKEKDSFDGIRVLGIDSGVNNFCAVTNNFKETPFLLSGRHLKSVNRYYNKRLAELKSEAMKCNKRYSTKRIERLHEKRNRIVKDLMHKYSRFMADYAKEKEADYVILGHNTMQKQKADMGKANNQKYVQIPFLQFAGMLKYKLEEYGIRLILTEESYTSKADFLAQDKIPVYGENEEAVKFSGKRIKRGLYQHGNGAISNADINGAGNIMRKVFPNVTEWGRGVVDTPYVVKVA